MQEQFVSPSGASAAERPRRVCKWFFLTGDAAARHRNFTAIAANFKRRTELPQSIALSAEWGVGAPGVATVA